MNIILWILLGLLINTVIGCAVCAALDTKDRVFYRWYAEDPTGGVLAFAVVQFWPIMAVFMIKYDMDERKNRP